MPALLMKKQQNRRAFLCHVPSSGALATKNVGFREVANREDLLHLSDVRMNVVTEGDLAPR